MAWALARVPAAEASSRPANAGAKDGVPEAPPFAAAGSSHTINYGPATGALVIGREDLLRVRMALGRLNDELHLIMGILDHHLSAEPMPILEQREAVLMPRNETVMVQRGQFDETLEGVSSVFGWCFRLFVFVFDICIVVAMQLFHESIGHKPTSVMSMHEAIDCRAQGHGATDPPPSMTTEEQLVASVSENWDKIVVGLVLAASCRVPQQVFADNFVSHMVTNTCVMLRCMSVVMLLVQKDMNPPKQGRDMPGAQPARNVSD